MEGIIYRNLYDEDGAIISLDGKTLFKVPNVSRYRVPEGIEEIDINAFKNRPNLREIDIPYTVEWYMRVVILCAIKYLPHHWHRFFKSINVCHYNDYTLRENRLYLITHSRNFSLCITLSHQ